MKNKVVNPVKTIIALILFLGSCKKDPTPIPPNNDQQNQVQKASICFSTNLDLSGQPYHTSNLTAVISINNQQGVEIIKDSVIQITMNGLIKTGSIELPIGDYKLTSFRLEYGSANTHFAAPIGGSEKASLVQKPLSIEFKVKKTVINDIPVEVLKVQNGEKPQAFGYPSGAFDYGQEDSNPYLKIKIQAIMQIGDVLYDSIPASLKLTTYLNNGEKRISYFGLTPGVNELSLLKAATKYDLQVSKWGTNDLITINRPDIDQVSIYTLGGSKAAKKLKSEIVAKEVNGIYRAESKTDYIYNAAGNISKIEYWLKRPDNTNYISMTDRFDYSGSRVQKITRNDEQNQVIMNTTSFVYDNQGRVIDMVKDEDNYRITAKVGYYTYNRPEIKISYDYPGSLDLEYVTTYYRGNIFTSYARRTNGDVEEGNYEYDYNINPYKHMNWPDMNLSHYAKNNMTAQRIAYYGSYPQIVPYSFTYTYDNDGYPTSLIKQYKSYITGSHIATTKTLFYY